jgi:hypothetical protein
MSYGFKGNMVARMAQLNALRTDPERPQNLSFSQFLAEHFKTGDGAPIEPGHIYSELGVDPTHTRVKDLYNNQDAVHLMPEIIRDGILKGLGVSQREQIAAREAQLTALLERLASLSPILSEAGGQRFISPEVILDPLQRGAVQAAFYRDLVMDEIMVASPDITVPHLDVSDAQLKDSDEAVTLEEGSVKYDTKKVTLLKKARLIKISYEAIWFNTLNLVSKWYLDVGRKLGASLNGMAVSAIFDGDQTDGSEAAAVIGVSNPNVGIQHEDITRVWIQFALLGRLSTDIVANAAMSNKYLNLPEVKNKQVPGAALLPTMVKTPMPTSQNLYPSGKAKANQIAIQDSALALLQLTCVPLMVESDKIIAKQIAESTATIYTGFTNVQRDARVVIDETLDIDDAGFPPWMQPIED